jgi:peptide deformylase
VPGSGVLYAVINPEIVEASPEIEEGVEGCLSIPGWVWLGPPAPGGSSCAASTRRGGGSASGPRGLVARVFQHEIDHLDGILFPDRIQDPTRIWRAQPVPEPVS